MELMKRILTLALVFCLALGLCACTTGNEDPTDGSTEASTSAGDTQDTTVADGKLTYTIKVVDEGGNPIAGALVQLCLDTCFPGATDDTGVAEFSMAEADYKVSFLSLPEGYTYSTDAQEFYFESGKTDMTITLKAVA